VSKEEQRVQIARAETTEGRWGDPVRAAREAELVTLLHQWNGGLRQGGRRGPVDGARLSGADASYLASQATERLNLAGARLEGADLTGASLERADLRGAIFDKMSRLGGVRFNGALLDQVAFDSTNLSAVDWRTVRTLGDEIEARQHRTATHARKKAAERQGEYYAAARTYRMLAVSLQSQGIIAAVARFQYQGREMARNATFQEALASLFSRRFYMAPWHLFRWLVTSAFAIFAGYGVYHMWRLFITYAGIVIGFAVTFYLAAHTPLRWPASGREVLDPLALSVTAFHGRGLQPAGLQLAGELMDALAIIEAVLGLLIEGLFIAAFTRRVTGNY
jgi:pentapeptide repeat protein